MAGFWFPNGDVLTVYNDALERAVAALAPLGTVWDSSWAAHYKQKDGTGMATINTNTAVAEINRFRHMAERRQAAAAAAAAAQGASYSLQDRAHLR